MLSKIIRHLVPGLTVAILTCSPLCHGQEIQVDIYAMQDSPPYSFIENKELKGIYTDIVNAAFEKMHGYQINILPVPFRRGLSFVESGVGFGIFPPYHRPQTRPYISPYSVPIINEEITVYCLPEVFGENKRLNWPEDFFKLTIGTNSGYTIGGDAFWEAVKQGRISIQQSESHIRSVMLLSMGRVDCYLTDKLSFQWALKRIRQGNETDALPPDRQFLQGPVISREQGYLGFSAYDEKFSFKEDFVEQFNRAIEELRINGEIDIIVKRYTD